jgi:NH3-dependent NAD+ synthetase
MGYRTPHSSSQAEIKPILQCICFANYCSQETLVAAPSADLWEGQTDEEELGFTYDFIELFTGSYLKMDEVAGEEGILVVV